MLGFESPLSGPGPVVNTKRTRAGTSDTALLVGDYTNQILKPAAAEIVKKARGDFAVRCRVPGPRCHVHVRAGTVYRLEL